MEIHNLSLLNWELVGTKPHYWRLWEQMDEMRIKQPENAPVTARMPGSVQQSLLDAGIIPDWNVGTNYRDIEWIENRHWIYFTDIPDNFIDTNIKTVLSCKGLDGDGENILRDQEIPAVYPISALKNLYSYFGSAPFTNAAMDNPAVVYLSSGFWGRYNSVTEKWMAFVDDTQWGIGVYSPTATKFLAGMSGSTGGEATSASTSYISPVRQERLMKNSVMDYEYYLIIGTLNEIRSKIYQIKSITSVEPLTKNNSKLFPNPVENTLFINNSGLAQISIFNANARLLKQNTLQENQNIIDVADLEEGIYFLQYSTKGQHFVSRFIKR